MNTGTTFRIELPIYQSYKKLLTKKLLKATKKREAKENGEN
ncbi:MAG: hypothetical protein U5K00_08715 [Melioribacteraceae bacterium]|nr:hypothetical protein [Melioribacteraceae bacterium]